MPHMREGDWDHWGRWGRFSCACWREWGCTARCASGRRCRAGRRRWGEDGGAIVARAGAGRGPVASRCGAALGDRISLRKQDILTALNKEAGSEVLKDIRFVGAWDARRPGAGEPGRKTSQEKPDSARNDE